MRIRKLLVVVLSCAILGPASAQTSVEEWQLKAVGEFPELALEGSPLHAKFVQRYQAKKKTDPAFFDQNDWPYRLVKECARPEIIPGLDAPPATPPPRLRPASTPKPSELLAAEELSTQIAAGNDADYKGRSLKITGVVARLDVPALGTNEVFYVWLRPNVICEVRSDSILSAPPAAYGVPRDVAYWWDYYYPRNPRFKVRFDTGHVVLQRASDFRNDKYVNFKDVKEFFTPGSSINFQGTCEGLGNIGTRKGLLMRNCVAIAP